MQAAAVLEQQTGNHRGLKQYQRERRQDLPPIFTPRSRLAKINLASRRQTALVNSPALQFTPIILRRGKPNRFDFDAIRLFSTKYAYSDSTCFFAQHKCRQHRAADDFSAKECVIMCKNRRICRLIEGRQRPVAFIHRTRRINDHCVPKDRGVWWKTGGLFQYVLEREIVVPSDVNPIFQRPQVFLNFVAPKQFIGRMAIYYSHGLCVWRYLQKAFEESAEVEGDCEHNIVQRKT